MQSRWPYLETVLIFMTSLQQIGRPNLHAILRPRGASHEVLFATPAAVFRRFQELFQVCQTQMPISFETEVLSRVNSSHSHTWFILSWPFPLPFVSFGQFAVCGCPASPFPLTRQLFCRYLPFYTSHSVALRRTIWVNCFNTSAQGMPSKSACQ